MARLQFVSSVPECYTSLGWGELQPDQFVEMPDDIAKLLRKDVSRWLDAPLPEVAEPEKPRAARLAVAKPKAAPPKAAAAKAPEPVTTASATVVIEPDSVATRSSSWPYTDTPSEAPSEQAEAPAENV